MTKSANGHKIKLSNNVSFLLLLVTGMLTTIFYSEAAAGRQHMVLVLYTDRPKFGAPFCQGELSNTLERSRDESECE